MERMKHDDVADKLSSHYLGGRDFGPLLTAGTLFASLFSGYTVIGVPNDAFNAGFMAIDWIPSLMGIVAGYFGTGLRLLKTSMVRNHNSPVDFLTDRYQSQLLRYMIVFLQVVPTVIYLSAQVIAIKGTFNSIFELDADNIYPTVAIVALILIFEWVGGLNSVALTDTIQAIVMVISFVVIPSVIAKNFGGWSDIDPETYPRPEFYQTPTAAQQWDFWQFALVNVSFFTLPHLLQRTYAAKTPQSLKMGYGIMAIGPWFTSLVGVFMGTIGVVILTNEDGTVQTPSNPFASILESVMDLGGLPKVAGIVCVTASLAAIMSTADSLIIAISQLVTVELVYPLRPNTTPTEISFIGKGVSLAACVFALLVGVFWDEGVRDLGNIQFSLSAQAVPAFLIGLFSTSKKTDIHPWCLFAGCLASTGYVVGIYFGYLKPVSDSLALDAGVTGFIIQVIVAVICEAVRRMIGGAAATESSPHMVTKGDEQFEIYYAGRPEWDIPHLARFGQGALTPERVWKNMEGIKEPMANPYWCYMMFFVLSMCTPWCPESEPPLNPDGDNVFLYPPKTVNGLPWWFFKILLISLSSTALLLIGISKIEDDFPVVNGEDFDDDDDLLVKPGEAEEDGAAPATQVIEEA